MKLKLDGEMRELLWDVTITMLWFAVIYALFLVVSILVVIVTAIDPSPSTARLYDMLVDVLTTAIGVALGLGLGRPFVRRGYEPERTEDDRRRVN